jgi:transcription elongation factor Elf1
MPPAPSPPPATPGPHSIISLSLGGHAVLQQLDTTLRCEACGRETQNQILYLGLRIAEVRCVECGRCMGMDREGVIRAFIGEIVIHMLRLPREVTREFKRDPGKAVATLPRQMAKLPRALAQDAIRLLRMVSSLREDDEALDTLFSQVDTTLLCQRCNRETPHRILYLSRRVAEARCTECGRGIGMTREEVFSEFVGAVMLHLLRLPRHVRQELRSDFVRAVQTVPREMVRMPFRVARDFIRLIRVLRGERRQGRLPVRPGREA